MKIGVIVHSFTGNTLEVAEKIKQELETMENTVKIERVKAIGETLSASGNIELEEKPAILDYDLVIFAAPTRAFSISPVLKEYLKQLDNLSGKKAICYVTQAFPFAWMGGNNSVKQIKKACEQKGIEVLNTCVVN